MAKAKCIAIADDVYSVLLNMKHGNDTFTDVLKRLLSSKTKVVD